MELVYLWVEEYKNIRRQGFNFSPRFRCEYNPDTNELTIDVNDDYIENFFGDNINVTAIVGKNGSGKSSVLELLSNEADKPFLLISYTDKNFNYYSHIIQEINTNYQNRKKIIKTKKFSYNIIEPIVSQAEENPNFFYTFKKLLKSDKKLFTFLNKNFTFDKYYRYVELNTLKNENEIKNAKNNKFYFFALKMINDLLTATQKLSKMENPYQMIHQRFLYYKNQINHNINVEQYETLLKEIEDDISNENLNDYIISINTIAQYIYDSNHSIYRTEALEFTNDHNDSEIYLAKEDFINEKHPQYNYKNLSSGERKLLNVFTLLLNSLQHKKEKLILTIDEPDIYLHPNWQKEFIFLLLKNKNLLQNKHLILTTHSPFLLSDIPKQNIIFLDTYKKNDSEVKAGEQEVGNCRVLPHEEVFTKKQTFGANIHTLLSDSFFMDNGFMGEFAKGKINEIIRFLRNKSHDDETESLVNTNNHEWLHDREKILNVIKMIGEPFLKNKLLELYYEKYTDERTKEQRRRELEAQKAQIDRELSQL